MVNYTMLIGSSLFLIGVSTLFKKICFQENNKEIESSSLSLASPPATISPNWIHHVFPSFHGPDVRKAFLSHILQSLKNNGIKPFIDNDIERSKPIGPELIEAIRGSRIAIVLLSKNYASSSWCLDELVEIMRCREVLSQIVITIFYDVQPTDIRKQTGKFGKAFKKSCKCKPKENIERWRKALEDVAAIAGMDSSVWDNEAAMIEKLTNEVSDKLINFTLPREFKDLVGMSTHMEEIERLFSPNVNERRMIGIWGPPGIGKTTIATFLFHRHFSRFQRRGIMVNIKFSYPHNHLDNFGAREKLQRQMLLQIFNQKEISNLQLALNGLEDKKVLLVLDDVDCIEQVHALAKEIRWFGPGSYIIITTENRRLLEAQGIEHIYEVTPPSNEEAFKIFCMNAFGKEYPDDGFYGLSWEATDLAGSLPLGLKVLGSAFQRKSKQEWKMEMAKLRNCLDREIESIIKFSYNALSDDEKDLFLYIACFFKFTNEVEVLLANKFLNVKESLHVLVEKSFISIDKPSESIEMHSLLEKFGRETARKQYIHGIKKRRLLVDARDICDDNIDCSKFIGVKLDFYGGDISEEELNELNMIEKAVERMSDVQFVSIIDGDNGCAPCERLHSLLYHSQNIRYLHWNYFQNKSLPATFNPEYLVKLDMSASKLEKLWEGNKSLNCLKWMYLSHSDYLEELPDLSTATNLEYLDISYCSSLKKLRKFHLSNKLVSSQLSDSLTYINARNCESLERLDCSFKNPDICLIFINCFKLNRKARHLIMHTSTSTYAVLPGKHVPTCFNYKATDGGSLTIKLNETSFSTSLRFQACIILERAEYGYSGYPSINIMVRNKEETRDYLSGYKDNIMVKNKRQYIPHAKTEHIYTFEIEVSEVTSTEVVFEFQTEENSWFKVGECGLFQIFEDLNKRLSATFNPESLLKLDMSASNLQKLWEGHKVSTLIKDLIWMSSHMEEIKRLFSPNVNEGRMIGIWGPPGIGKTTIARFLFHQLSSRFQLRGIMVNIKASYPFLDEYDAQMQLQHQMLSQMINQKEVPNLELALNGLKDKKVLLVLDDVDRIEQVHALAKEIGWFGPGSCIIITTENRRILEAQGIKHIYQVKSSSSEEDLKIFCMNAFGKEYPDDGFYELAREVTYLAGSLPLGLKVLGSALRGMSKEEWKMEMPTLRNCLDGEMESIMKFSYNALSDEEKDLFLYIACFFNFTYPREVEVLLAKKFSNVKKSLHVLVEKFFISIDKPHEYIKMHSLLEKFGRETARKQYVHGIKKRRLLVDARDICDDTIDGSEFIGIELYFFKWAISEEELNELNMIEKAVETMSDVQFISIIDNINGCGPCERLHSLLYHSQKIRYLKWYNFQNESLPATFNPEYLVKLDMIWSKLEKLWEGNKPFNCLKFIDLRSSRYLEKLPDLSTATNLEYLNISGCSSLRKLRKVPLSPHYDSLNYIDASDCRSLERLECSLINPDICLNFINCFKLNQNARDIIMHTPTSRYAVLPGKHVPTYFNYRATDGGSLTIKLNETFFHTSLRFQACIILEQIARYGTYIDIKIKVRNKKETRDYLSGYEDINIMVKNKCQSIYAIREHIYIFEVEVGEVTSTEFVFDFETNDSSNWKVREYGLLHI